MKIIIYNGNMFKDILTFDNNNHQMIFDVVNKYRLSMKQLTLAKEKIVFLFFYKLFYLHCRGPPLFNSKKLN